MRRWKQRSVVVLYFPSMHYHDDTIGRGVGPRIMVESVAERARQLFAKA